jgi:subtilisin-like proprotein convertase family protein
MDKKHSKGLRSRYIIAAGMAVMLLCQTMVSGVIYTSFGTSVKASFGSPDEKGVTIISQLYIPFRGTITDLDISLDLKHTSFCDLVITIESPTGVSATISIYAEDTFVKGKQCFGWITLDNESTIKIDFAQNLSVGSFLPTGLKPISRFYGRQSFGMWKIKICDQIYYDTGTLDGIRFDMAIEPDIPVAALAIPEPVTGIFSIGGLFILFRNRR